MEIGIIGATGKAGTLIAKEAARRGHHVTAIARDGAKMKDSDWDILECDVFDLTAAKLERFQVVVDAFGTPHGAGLEFQHQTSMLTLINALDSLPSIRLMVVGSAAGLYTDHDRQNKVADRIPGMDRAVSLYMMQAFETLKESRVNWTYFCPAKNFDFAGAGTGKYRLGTDYVIVNDEGESYLSYRDYALAMVDEIENGNYIKKQFTAVTVKNAGTEHRSTPKKKTGLVFRVLQRFKNGNQ